MKRFKKDTDLDAKLLFSGMRGGLDAIINTAFLMRNKINAEDIIARCYWLKKQSKDYKKHVIALVIKMESRG